MDSITISPLAVISSKWDKEAQVWVAESEDIPGLVVEADTIESLIEKLKVVIKQLYSYTRHWHREHELRLNIDL